MTSSPEITVIIEDAEKVDMTILDASPVAMTVDSDEVTIKMEEDT